MRRIVPFMAQMIGKLLDQVVHYLSQDKKEFNTALRGWKRSVLRRV
jgi:hypothetical protein